MSAGIAVSPLHGQSDFLDTPSSPVSQLGQQTLQKNGAALTTSTEGPNPTDTSRAGANHAIPELVPARMLNEYAYCPRLAYLEWVQGEFKDSVDTVEGRFQRRMVDRPSGELPTRPAGCIGRSTDRDDDAPRTIHARSVMLSDHSLGIIARIDLVEGSGKVVTPVDYKRGRVPDVADGAWEPERVHICIQGLLLRANGYTCAKGMLYSWSPDSGWRSYSTTPLSNARWSC